MICVGVRRGYERGRDLRLDLINLNTSACWFHEDDREEGTETVIPRYDQLNVVSVTQLEKDSILVCYDSKYYYKGLQHLQRSSNV